MKNYLHVKNGIIMRLIWFEELNKLLKKSTQQDLFENGAVVWGNIIQANGDLFGPGDDDLPGEFVFSLDQKGMVEPEYLAQVASRLGNLKGTKPAHPDLLPIADYLTDELIRVFGWDVPRRLSPKVKCKISTTLFARKHLPGGLIANSVMPLIVSVKEPHYVMVLPERFWPDDLKQFWSAY